VGDAGRLEPGRGVTRLLVSVVSAAEARRALAGGADIVDVKDPRAGALGPPATRVVSEVVQAVSGAAPISVALGDLPDLPPTSAVAGVTYVKVGLRGAAGLGRAVSVVSAVADAVGPRTAVIAATYADAHALDPPALAPSQLPELVERTGIAGALVDTFVKDGRGLYGWLSEAELAELVTGTRAAGGTLGVAGQLRLDELCRVDADVVGVRSAVCRGGDRTSSLDAGLVAAAVAEVRQPGVIRVPASPTARTRTVTPVRRTASGM
jgi:uncharacterized protein (UPF0264 family)